MTEQLPRVIRPDEVRVGDRHILAEAEVWAE